MVEGRRGDEGGDYGHGDAGGLPASIGLAEGEEGQGVVENDGGVGRGGCVIVERKEEVDEIQVRGGERGLAVRERLEARKGSGEVHCE